MSHDIEGLRQRLFAAIDGVTAGTLDIDKARMISDLSQVIVNTAKVEVDFARATERRTSAFLGAHDEYRQVPALPDGITGVRRHLCKDD